MQLEAKNDKIFRDQVKEIFVITRGNIVNIIWPLAIIFMLMIGRYWDIRLSYYGFNLPFMLMIFSPIISLVHASRKSLNTESIDSFSIFISMIFFYNIVLFVFYGYNTNENYSFTKLFFIIFFLPFLLHFRRNYQKLPNAIFLMYNILGIIVLLGFVKSFFTVDRLAVLGGGPIVFARWVGIFVILSFYYLEKRFWKVLIFLIGIYLILKSGSKGPLLFFLVAFIAPAVRIKLNYLALAGALGVLVFNLRSHLLALLGPRISILFSADILNSTSGAGRLERWTAAWNVFLEYPMGVGLGNYVPYSKMLESNDFFLSEYPHNFFLELISEMGYFGIILCLLFTRKFILSYGKTRILAYRRVILFVFLNMQVSGDIMDGRLLYLLIL